MLIRRNTKAFKTIEQIITSCKDRSDRMKLVRVYITKAGHSFEDRIPVEGIEGGAELFYDMTYQAVLNNLKSANHQLQQSDDVEGIYFFHSSSNKVWDETPFEFDEALRKEFAALPDLPVFRKKEKSEKFNFPTTKKPSETKTSGAKPAKQKARPATNEKARIPVRSSGPPQPDFKLKYSLHFTDLEKIIFRQPELTRRDVLKYYNDVSEFILPWLKDRPLTLRFRRPDGRKAECSNIHDLEKTNIEIPPWLDTGKKGEYLLCNDREHLLFWIESGCIQFETGPFLVKNFPSPDYLVIGIESPDADCSKAVEVANISKIIFQALKLRGFVKTNGVSGIHILIPLDAKDDIETAHQISEYLCKLIRLKIPDRVALEGSADREYGKVRLEYSMNTPDGRIVTPYSLLEGDSAKVATPLSWEELTENAKFDEFTPETNLKKAKQSGDPWAGFRRKKISATVTCKQLEEHYGFLF